MKSARELRWLRTLRRFVLAAAVGSIPVALAFPEGYALTASFCSFVLFMLIEWVRDRQ
jgi:hypothetical protein